MPRTKRAGAGTYCSKESTPRSISYTTRTASKRHGAQANSLSIALFGWKSVLSNEPHTSRLQTTAMPMRSWRTTCSSKSTCNHPSDAGFLKTKIPGAGGSDSITRDCAHSLKLRKPLHGGKKVCSSVRCSKCRRPWQEHPDLQLNRYVHAVSGSFSTLHVTYLAGI